MQAADALKSFTVNDFDGLTIEAWPRDLRQKRHRPRFLRTNVTNTYQQSPTGQSARPPARDAPHMPFPFKPGAETRQKLHCNNKLYLP